MSMIGNYVMADEFTVKRIQTRELSLFDYAFSDDIEDEKYLDIDRAWHAIHFALTGKANGSDPSDPLSNVVLGNDKSMGYDIVLFNPAQVRAASDAIEGITEQEFRERFDMEKMAKNKIYPSHSDGDEEEAFEYVWSFFECVQDFYKRASKQNLYIFFFVN